MKMKIIEFNYKKDNINKFIVVLFSIIVSTAFFLNIQDKFYMNFIYLGMGLITLISILTHVRKAKTSIHTLTFKDNLVVVNFKHTLIDPVVIDLNETICEMLNGEIFIKNLKNGSFIKLELINLKRKEDAEELIFMLNL